MKCRRTQGNTQTLCQQIRRALIDGGIQRRSGRGNRKPLPNGLSETKSISPVTIAAKNSNIDHPNQDTRRSVKRTQLMAQTLQKYQDGLTICDWRNHKDEGSRDFIQKKYCFHYDPKGHGLYPLDCWRFYEDTNRCNRLTEK